MEWLLVLEWLLALFVLTAIGAPLAAWLFPAFPRKGAAFALPVTLLGVALVVFWIGQVTFGWHAVIAAVLVTAGASTLAYRRGGVPDWRAVTGAFGVFAAGFLLLVLFRASNPAITPAGGEQFLHFGLTKALARAPALPPEDFWFAGEPMRYYFGTQLQVTSLATLTGTPLRLGYNLGLAAFYGVLVVSAYGLVGAIVDAAGYSRRLGGALGAFIVAIGGATTTAVRLLYGVLPEDLALGSGGPAFGAIRHMPYEEAVLTQSNPAEWFWFYTRYVVPGTLQEFPFYAFIKADLHGHTLSTGYVVVAAALAYSYYRLPAERRGRRLAALIGGLGVVSGVFGFMNTWSLPTSVGLAWLAVAAADAHPATLLPDDWAERIPLRDGAPAGEVPSRVGRELWRVVLAVVPAGLVGLIGVALASPFLVFGDVPRNEGIGLFPPRSPLGSFLVIYAGLLAVVGAYLLDRGWPVARRYDRRVVAGAAVIGLLAGVLVAVPLAFPVLAVVGPLLVAAWWLVRTDRIGFAGVLVVAGLGLLLSMELLFAKVAPWPEGPTRWNTTYKVSIQAWVLLALGVGGIGAILLSDARAAIAGLLTPSETTRPATSDGGTRRGATATVLAGVLVVVVVLASGPFPVLAAANQVGGHLADGGDLHLDGLADHERLRAEEMAAIDWLDARPGTPTIVEAPGEAVYAWTNPASSLTGVPTVVGWLRAHEENYRPQARVDERVAAVDAIYDGSWADAAAALRQYDVGYVYVGPRERETYGALTDRFAGRQGLSVAFENEAVTIYRVSPSALDAG